MNPSPPPAAHQLLDVHGPRSSSAIVHRVPPASVEVFLEWQRGITAAAETFAGYQATEVFPPEADRPHDWVVILHFDDAKRLQDWIASPTRIEWTAKLPREIREFRIQALPSGFSAWFADPGAKLPHWKVFLMILFGLYPTVMVLTLTLAPHTKRFGVAIAILLGNIASCLFLEWFGSPLIRFAFGPWLRAHGREGRVRNVVGTVLIVGTILTMAVLFHFLAG